MQATRNGVWLEAQAFDAKELQSLMKQENVERVEVFKATEENLAIAKNRTGKKFKKSVGYKKATKIKKR